MPGSVKGTYLQLLTAYTGLYALFLAVVVVLGYFNIQVVPLPGVALGLTLVPLLYYLVLFRFVVSRLGRRTAYIIGIGLVCVPIFFVSVMTGGYSSPNNIALAFLVFLSAMLGPEVPLVLIWAQILGFFLTLSGFIPGFQATLVGAIYMLVSAMAALSGWALFRRYRVHEDPMIERLRQTLHDEQLRSEAVIAAISDGVAIVNREGVAIHANQRFLDMTALTSRELIGKPSSDVVSTKVRIVAASLDSPRIGPNVMKVLQTGETVTIDNETIEYADGRPSVDVSISIMPLKNDDGEVSAVMIISRDISHLMRLQRMKDSLISTASHELRTPITVIAGYADLLLGESAGRLTDKQRHYLERTKETTAHLTDMINDMLDISRLEAGQRENNPENIDLAVFLHGISEEQLGIFAAKHISLKIGEVSFRVHVDRGRLHQVVSNLLSNAYKFTGESGEVLVLARQVGDMVEISVKDNGIGIPTDQHKTIFEKFIKLDTTGSIPGAGLGLAIAKTLVESWGGNISIENVQPHGAQFFFTVPIDQSPVQKDSINKKGPSAHEATHHRR